MAEVINFPGKLRPDEQRILREGIAKAANGKLPKTMMDAMAKDLHAFIQLLEAEPIKLSCTLPSPLGREHLPAIEALLQQAIADVKFQIIGCVTRERLKLWVDGRLGTGH